MNLSEEELPKALQKHAEEENVKNNSTDNKKKKSKKIWLRILITIIILGILGISTLAFLLYGPYSGFREWLITSAMTTMRHQYLATWFYSDEYAVFRNCQRRRGNHYACYYESGMS